MLNLRTSFRRKIFLLLGMALALALPAYAQLATGTLAGTVEDPTGAVVPGAMVTVTNQGTNRSLTYQTDPSGTYRIVNLAPGLYTVKVETKGFKTVVNRDVELTVGATQHLDIKLELGQETQTITVEAAAPLVSTEEGRLSHLVNASEVANLPLNGRNIYQLMQLSPGAVNVADVMLENGADTVVNGLRENFNGFWIDGIANKGLSGGFNVQPNQDIVQEFRVNTLNMSAEYGNSAGSVTTIVTKAGSNDFHGTAYEFLRNDALDANEFFRNQAGCELGAEPFCNGPVRGDGKGNLAKAPLRFNQFGVTLGGPIRKDKTFFFASYQGSRTDTFAAAVPVTFESPQWRQAVINTAPNSVAALLYKDFPAPAGSPILDDNGDPLTVANYVGDFGSVLCPANLDPDGLDAVNSARIASNFQTLFGVTAAEAAACPGLAAGQTAQQITNRNVPFWSKGVALFGSQTIGNLYNADEWSARIDHNFGERDRLFGRFYWTKQTDKYGPANVYLLRGFKNPDVIKTPHLSLSWTHVFSSSVVNDLRAGFSRNVNDIDVGAGQAGVPYIKFDGGDVGFGAYNGYPQFFHETVYNYSDLLSITKGRHGLKMGVEFRRNIENSLFNVARPSYYFLDPIFFGADAAEAEVAGVDPGILTGTPAELASNNRAWRNLEMGAFIQDDWKVTPHLTLNIGLRYDLYKRHTEKFGRVTQFILGQGANVTEAVRNANIPAGDPGCDTLEQMAQAQIAGVCGSGGFATAKQLGSGDHNNFGPRFGFAWDPRGGGKTSLRGGVGVSYEGTLYNPLSNSRWNLPYYSFNEADGFLWGDVMNVIYGPHMVDGLGNIVFDPNTAPSYTGAPTNPGQGIGAQAEGNLTGWDPATPNFAYLTGVVPTDTFRDPYVYSYFLGVQHEVVPNLVFEVNYVGTAAHKLFRSQQVNRQRGGRLPAGFCQSDLVSGGDPSICGDGTGRANVNYGTLRFWENAVNSNYNSLQLQVTRKMSRGFAFTAGYTWGHAIDGGSDWHSGATSANGAAAGDGYSFDIANQGLDRGHATFDIRHRFTISQVWELPWHKGQQGFAGHLLGGWQFNSIWVFQSGAHWTPYDPSPRALLCSGGTADGNSANSGGGASACLAGGGQVVNVGGDFNLDRVSNDRPDPVGSNTVAATKDQYANGYFGTDAYSAGFVSIPCLACNGSLARNTMVGPGRIQTDLSLFKNSRISERVNLQFRAEFFNAFNRTNFKLPSSGTGGNGANQVNSPIFGVGNGAFDPRQIQLALKLIW
jgi:hypothetical protein